MSALPFLQKQGIWLVLVAFTVGILASLFWFDGTGGGGDSYLHFLMSKWAPDHPELFFDHWGKPVFVLLSTPFTQFGFFGMKLFNGLVALATIWLTYRSAQRLQLPNPVLAAFFCAFAPLLTIITFSGLTEPLFGLFLIAGCYLVLCERWLAAAILISFMPFVRSEGLIICGAFAGYFLVKGHWKTIPWLITGHVVYSIAGYFVHGDLLWVFNKIPYARLSSNYGNGDLFHYANQLVNVIGLPALILFVLGLLFGLRFLSRIQKHWEMTVLVYGGFLAFFMAHSLFWYLGIFNSMGLKRVLIGVLPLMALIALIGFNGLYDFVSRWSSLAARGLGAVLLVYVLVFPFVPNPASIKWDRDLSLSLDQQQMHQVAEQLDSLLPGSHRYVWSDHYFSAAIPLDPFDPEQGLELRIDRYDQIRPGDVIIWDDWFGPQSGITLAMLEENANLRMLLDHPKTHKREKQYVVFLVEGNASQP